MPSALPQILATEAGSAAALGSPRTHSWLHAAELPLQSLPIHPHPPNLPPPQPPQAPAGLRLLETAGKHDTVWTP